VYWELPDVQAEFRKGRGIRNQIANISMLDIEKSREFQKNIYFCFIDYAKTFDCVDHSKLENSWRDRNTKSPYLPPEGSLACCNPWRHKELDMHVLFCKGWLKLHDMWLWLLKEISLEVSNVKWESSLVAQMVKHLPTMWETWVRSLGWEDLLEKEMATHSSTLAWRIPQMEEPGRLHSMGSQRVRHNWETKLNRTEYSILTAWFFRIWITQLEFNHLH